MKENLTILWLDDQRNPLTYFKKKDEKGEGTFHDNLIYYQNLSRQYNLSFVWVKNYAEFVNYIKKNGVPEFVSFDHDLSKTSLPTEPKGLDCAKWLVNYCRENNVPMPETYVHSANPKWRNVIKDILNNKQNSEVVNSKKVYLTEKQLLGYIAHQLLEGVYIDGVKGNRAHLTYQQGVNRNFNSLLYTDGIKTDKMDRNDSDTYIVDLKGGMTAYNITSIRGEEVMHYFKNYFKRQKAEVRLRADNGDVKSYELEMEDREFKQFLHRFIMKVSFVIYHCLRAFQNGNNNLKFSGISIYPVKSSSNFNVEMAKQIAGKNLVGLPAQVIDENLFVKDLKNLQKDADFISKNKEFYNSPYSNIPGDKSVDTHLDANISRYNALQPARKYIEEMTKLSKALVIRLYNLRSAYKNKDRDTSKMVDAMVADYKKYYEYYLMCQQISYMDNITGKMRHIQIGKFAEQLKYSKNPQIEIRSNDVWNVVKSSLRKEKNPINGKPYTEVPLQGWTYKNFQIKNLSNGERMGLKNYFSPNENYELVQQELDKIKNTVFVIFDDNMSGGATLSDICYQAKGLGIEYIIPISFGQMGEKWTINKVPLNRPKDGFNYSE